MYLTNVPKHREMYNVSELESAAGKKPPQTVQRSKIEKKKKKKDFWKTKFPTTQFEG